MAEIPCQGFFVDVLHMVCKVLFPLFLASAAGFLDESHLEDGHYAHGQHQADHQVNGHAEGENLDDIAGLARHGEDNGVEDGADADGGQQHGHEILFHTLNGGLVPFHAFSKIFEITVDDHDGVVDNHSQHHDEACQRHDVERDVAGIHQADGDEGAERHNGGGDDSRTPGKENQHDDEDDEHRLHQIHHKFRYAVAHYLWEVGDGVEMYVVGDLPVAVFLYDSVDVLSVLYDVVSLGHLHAEEHATVAVLLDVSAGVVVFAYDACHVLHLYAASCGIAVDDLFGNLAFALLGGGDVEGDVTLVGTDASAHGGESLCGEGLCDGGLSDAVGCQALTVDVESELLLLVSYLLHVADAFYPSQTVGKFVAVLLKFAVGTLAAFYGHQSGAGVAEVVVRDNGHHALRQLLLEVVQSVLDFRPYLVLVVHVFAQVYHHHAHAVHGGGGGLFTAYLLEGKEVTFERTRHLGLYLFACGTGVDGNDHTLTDDVGWKFILRHHVHAV